MKASARPTSGYARTHLATSSTRARCPSVRRASPTSIPNPATRSSRRQRAGARPWSTPAPMTACCTRSSIPPAWPTPARKPGPMFRRRSSAPSDPNGTGTAGDRFSARCAQLSHGPLATFRSQVLRQRHAAHLGRRFRQHQHQDPADCGQQRLAHDAGRRARRRWARSLCARRDDTGGAERDTEADIASSGRVLWEKTFTDPGFENLGYVYDAPTLVKTKRFGWVALVVSGYNNKGGDGKLFVLNPTNGELLHTLLDRRRIGCRSERLIDDPCLYVEPKGPLCAAGLRRRPQGQCLAFRPVRRRPSGVGTPKKLPN